MYVLWMRRTPRDPRRQRNIVDADLKKAADASKISLKDAVRNIEKTLRDHEPSLARRQMAPVSRDRLPLAVLRS